MGEGVSKFWNALDGVLGSVYHIIATAFVCLIWATVIILKTLYIKKHPDAASLRRQVNFLRNGGGELADFYKALTKAKNDMVLVYYLYCRMNSDFSKIENTLTYYHFRKVRDKTKFCLFDTILIITSIITIVFLSLLTYAAFVKATDVVSYCTQLAPPIAMIAACIIIFIIARLKRNVYWFEFINDFHYLNMEGRNYFKSNEDGYEEFSRKILNDVVISTGSRNRVEKLIRKNLGDLTVGSIKQRRQSQEGAEGAAVERKMDNKTTEQAGSAGMPAAGTMPGQMGPMPPLPTLMMPQMPPPALSPMLPPTQIIIPKDADPSLNVHSQTLSQMMNLIQQQSMQQQHLLQQQLHMQSMAQQQMLQHQSQLAHQQSMHQSTLLQQQNAINIQQSQARQQDSFKQTMLMQHQNMMQQQQMSQSNIVNQGLMAQNAALQRQLMMQPQPPVPPHISLPRSSLTPMTPPGLPPIPPPPHLASPAVTPPVPTTAVVAPQIEVKPQGTVTMPLEVASPVQGAQEQKPKQSKTVSGLERAFDRINMAFDVLHPPQTGNVYGPTDFVVIDPTREPTKMEKRLEEFYNARVYICKDQAS